MFIFDWIGPVIFVFIFIFFILNNAICKLLHFVCADDGSAVLIIGFGQFGPWCTLGTLQDLMVLLVYFVYSLEAHFSTGDNDSWRWWESASPCVSQLPLTSQVRVTSMESPTSNIFF